MKLILKYFTLLILFVLLASYANASIIDIEINGGANGKIDSLKTILHLYPKNYDYQKVLSVNTNPVAYETSDILEFYWNNYENPKFSVKSRVKKNTQIGKIKEKLNNIDEYVGYLSSTEKIDSNNIDAKREYDDLFFEVSNTAFWVKKNINYDLESVAAEANQKASWVLENKKGVCDELTNLFIAMCRAKGIPAKFVSGIAYNEELGWGAHGWAEVYFSNYGWVPFDITFGQFGWIDSKHIKMQEKEGTNVRYEWRGSNVKFNPIKIDANLVELEENMYNIEIIGEIKEELVGFGSDNYVYAKIRNLNDYYIATEIYLSQTEGLEIFDNPKQIVLKPYEQKELRWTVRVDELDSNFEYTFPIIIYNQNNQDKISFKARNDGKINKLDNIEKKSKEYSVNNHLKYPKQVGYSDEFYIEIEGNKRKMYGYELEEGLNEIEVKINYTGIEYTEKIIIELKLSLWEKIKKLFAIKP